MYKIFDRRHRVRVDTLDVSELDVQFDVLRTVKASPNPASIRIYNLTEEQRAQIENLSLKEKVGGKTVKTGGKIRVEIEAGYKDSTSLIFRGDLRFATSEREGSDWVTLVEGDDGGRNILGARVARSFPAGTSVSAVVRACAQALGVGTGNLSAVEPELRTAAGTTFTGGTVLYGPASKELDRVLRSCGFRYSVQHGVLQISRPGQGLTVRAVSLTEDIIPAPTANPDGTIEVIAPLLPDLYPGGRVQLEAGRKRGLYVIQEVNYVGDTSADGTDWDARLKLKAP